MQEDFNVGSQYRICGEYPTEKIHMLNIIQYYSNHIWRFGKIEKYFWPCNKLHSYRRTSIAVSVCCFVVKKNRHVNTYYYA